MNDVSTALKALKEGRLIGLPTETVYGLAAPADSSEMIKKIFSLKERPFYDPLILHVSSVAMAKRYVNNWCPVAQLLADNFWPGPLTLILEKQEHVDDLITAGLKSVGVRAPHSTLSLQLIEELGAALAAPSANKFTKTSPSCAEHVRQSFDAADVFVLDGGACKVGIESTIVSLLRLAQENIIEILRPGMITSQEIMAVIPKTIKIQKGSNAYEKKAARLAPGLETVHYRPEFPCGVVNESRLSAVLSLGKNYEHIRLDLDPSVTARVVYSLLRKELDRKYDGRYFVLNLNEQVESGLQNQQMWQSILDRLLKASTLPCFL